LLNRAARYFPILREIKRLLDVEGVRVLEVGSGSLGLGEFWGHPFVGCDLNFPSRPHASMRAVQCSGTRLPFVDKCFDVVVASDVMEHVPPDSRENFISEVLRVSRKVAVFGYPCGALALALDRGLYEQYLRQNTAPPIWLVEHMMHPFPDDKLFAKPPTGWRVTSLPNESLDFHSWMMRMEMHHVLNYVFRFGLLLVPKGVEKLLRRVDREPSYRRIFVLSRQ
jgi:hypothetical protein